MTSVIWTPSAFGDLTRLHAFLAPKDPTLREVSIRAIRLGVRVPRTHPELGRPDRRDAARVPRAVCAVRNSGYAVLYP
jgi:plasmid stabilization system protein ParE